MMLMMSEAHKLAQEAASRFGPCPRGMATIMTGMCFDGASRACPSAAQCPIAGAGHRLRARLDEALRLYQEEEVRLCRPGLSTPRLVATTQDPTPRRGRPRKRRLSLVMGGAA